MPNFVIIRSSDKTGETQFFGPVSEAEAAVIIAGRLDHDEFAYYTAGLQAPIKLEKEPQS